MSEYGARVSWVRGEGEAAWLPIVAESDTMVASGKRRQRAGVWRVIGVIG